MKQHFVLHRVEKAGLGKDTVIFYDFEYDTVKQAKEKGVNLGKNESVAFTKAFCEYVTSHGYKGIYSNIDYHKNMYTDELISQYIYWLADYTGDPWLSLYVPSVHKQRVLLMVLPEM